MNINVVVFTGRLTRDPDLKYTPNGKPVCKFSVAFDSGWGDNKKANFVDCTSWAKTAEIVSEHFKKGSRIGCTGRLDYQAWEKNGEKKSKLCITVNEIEFLDPKEKKDPVISEAEEIFT